ncbi:hypothetical protein N7G274_000447 [Stereocaulon virgatum]|uniref:Pheromone alpha factor receptor n=1 Tax=Stereocaulon virgatum TaxID=373712 RepID=A0ABR4ASV1_9LECA
MNSTTPFNPYEQSFTLLGADGTPFNVTIPDLDSLLYYYTQSSINFGAQLGASIVLLIVLLLLTKRDKRTSAIFIINALALVFNIIRTVMFCLYFTGPWVETYAYFGQDYARVHTRDYAESVNSSVFTFLVLVCIDTSLCLQTRVVCITLRSIYRIGILTASILVALVGIGFHFTLAVENCILIVDAKAEDSLNWIVSASQIANTISISFFCTVFTVKLGFALRQRKKLGLVQFGPMQVLFIMGCQTLVIPVLFSVLQFCVSSPQIGSNTLTSAAIFLPLSSLWASASLDSHFADSKAQHFSGKTISSYATKSSGPMEERKTANVPRHDNGHMMYRDLEAQGLAGTGDFVGKEQT